MIVPEEILEKLKCSNCDNLLSCGPVFLKYDGSNICGRCCKIELEESGVPNEPYNALAKICVFPCKFESEGCVEKLPFASVQQHEQDCDFHTYLCPVMANGSCGWVGSRNRILEHTQETHPDQVLQHPCHMDHDVHQASFKTFLTSAFNLLFLVYVKVCLTTHTIYHSVRKVGEIHEARCYKYHLNIENDNGLVMRKGDVSPQGSLAMQEDASIGIKINSIMEALGGYNNIKFTIILLEFMKCFKCKVVKNAEKIEVYDKVNNIFYCKTCLSTLNCCKNASAGCLWKGDCSGPYHENFLCTFAKWCDECDKDIKEYNMLSHLRKECHKKFIINHLVGKYLTINFAIKKKISISFKNKSYLFVYYKKENRFTLRGCIDDFKIQCIVILRNPKTKYTAHYIMEKRYGLNHGQFYFNLFLHNDKLRSFINEDKFEVGVDIYNYE